jgi:hypothetical protein
VASVWSGRRPRWECPPPGLPPTHPQNAHGHSNGPVFRRPSLAGFGCPLTIHSARNCSRRRPVSTRTLPTRNLGPRPGNRSGYAGGQEWWGMALTRSPQFSWNGRPVGPDDGPFGPESREPHNHPSVPTGGRPPRENHWLLPAADHPAPQTSFRPNGPAVPPARPSGPGQVPRPRRSPAQRANNSSSPGTSLAPSTLPHTSRGQSKSSRLLYSPLLNSLGLRSPPNNACTPKGMPENAVQPDQRGRHSPTGPRTSVCVFVREVTHGKKP